MASVKTYVFYLTTLQLMGVIHRNVASKLTVSVS